MTIMTLPLINHLFGCIVSSLPVIVSPNIFLFTKCCLSLSSYFNWIGKFLNELWSPHWKKTKTPKTISVLWNLLDSWKDWSWSWSNLLKWKRFWWKNANKLRGQDRGLLLRGPAWYQLDLDLLGPLHQWFYQVLVLPWLTIIPATIGNKLYQLHLHSRAFRDIITINQSIPTCHLCRGSKCLEWGQGCPCQQCSSHLLQMSCSTLQGMYSLLSINQCFDLYLVLALV